MFNQAPCQKFNSIRVTPPFLDNQKEKSLSGYTFKPHYERFTRFLSESEVTSNVNNKNNAIYTRARDGTIWRYTGPSITGWQMLDNNPRARVIAACGGLYQLHGDGTIWYYIGPPMTGWQKLDENPATTAILAAQ